MYTPRKKFWDIQEWLPKFQYLIRIKLHTWGEYGYRLSFHIITCKRKTFVFNMINKENQNCPTATYNLSSMHQTLVSQHFRLKCNIPYGIFLLLRNILTRCGTTPKIVTLRNICDNRICPRPISAVSQWPSRIRSCCP